MKIWLLALVLLFPFAGMAASPDRAIAITFDDLPFASVPAEDSASLERMTSRLLHHLQTGRVPAVGFVNEAKLYRGGSLDPTRVELLRKWLRAGFELGNHTASHPSLNRVPLETFEADLLLGEAVTRPLMHAEGRVPRWFRHPFLHLGTTSEIRAAFHAFLTTHGYAEAPVTVNGPEWLFAAAYSNAHARGDTDAARRIGAAYVPYMESVFTRSEQLALNLFGRPISHVLVLHANALNADYFDALAAMLRQRGYRFVELADALKDSAYTSPVDNDGLNGESWLELWSRHAGLRPPQQPAVPGFVRQWAGPTAVRGY